MGESAPTGNSAVEKRRSSRVAQSVPILVTGVDALGRTFQERTATEVVNCQGCRYPSRHYLLKNMRVTVEVPVRELDRAPRRLNARVAWTQRPHTVRELFQVNVELDTGGNVWGLDAPPEDWFPFPQSRNGDLEMPLKSPHETPETVVEEDHPEDAPALRATQPKEDNLGAAAPPGAHGPGPIPREEIARIIDETKQELRAAARQYAAEAASEEAQALLAALQLQLRSAADHYVAAAAASVMEKAVPRREDARQHPHDGPRLEENESVEQIIGAAMERMSTGAADIEHNLDDACRAAAEKWIAAIAKAADITQNTFASLFKTAEWYEKRFKTRMQEAVETGLREAADAMRDKAGEIAVLFSGELSDFSRSYLEHTQQELEALEKWAENRLNEICRQVFSDAGQELRRRLSDFDSSAPLPSPASPQSGEHHEKQDSRDPVPGS